MAKYEFHCIDGQHCGGIDDTVIYIPDSIYSKLSKKKLYEFLSGYCTWHFGVCEKCCTFRHIEDNVEYEYIAYYDYNLFSRKVLKLRYEEGV